MTLIRLIVDGVWYWTVGYRIQDADGFGRLVGLSRLIAARWRPGAFSLARLKELWQGRWASTRHPDPTGR